MQDVIGTILFVAICLGSALFAYAKAEQDTNSTGVGGFFPRVLCAVIYFVVTVIVVYLALGILLAIVWVVAWFGALLREIVMWLIEAILAPWRWIS